MDFLQRHAPRASARLSGEKSGQKIGNECDIAVIVANPSYNGTIY